MAIDVTFRAHLFDWYAAQRLRARLHILAGFLGALACSSSVKPVESITPLNHDVFFVTSTGPHKLDCNECHGTTDDFQKFVCTDCHEHRQAKVDPIHLGLATNYTYEPMSCYQCHATRGVQFDHALYFPIRTGAKHAGIACQTCHTNNVDRRAIDCLSCHPANPTDALHDDVGGYLRESPRCIGCHPDSIVKKVAQHLPFHIDDPYAHFKTACDGCHSERVPGKPWQVDFTRPNCLDCHPASEMNPKHSGLPSYKYETPTCLNAGCHKNGDKP